MKLTSTLTPDRVAEGVLRIELRCRGHGDLTGAIAHGNPFDDPTKAYGNHPAGVYDVTAVIPSPSPAYSFGPAFLRLMPVSGEALDAAHNGRSGFGIHGGDLRVDGSLRDTFGCLRVDNATAQALATLVEGHLPVRYECVVDGAITRRRVMSMDTLSVMWRNWWTTCVGIAGAVVQYLAAAGWNVHAPSNHTEWHALWIGVAMAALGFVAKSATTGSAPPSSVRSKH